MPTAEKARAIIEKMAYAAVATVSESAQPWNAPVFVAYDAGYNFYWGTYRESQKSKNIRVNNNVFLVLFDSTVSPGTGEGVYIKATAQELNDPRDIEYAHKLLWDRHIAPYWKLDQVQGNAPIRLYKAIPQKIWMNGEGQESGNYIDTRIEVKL